MDDAVPYPKSHESMNLASESHASGSPHTSQSPWQTEFGLRHTQILLNSFRQFLGRELLDRDSDPAEESRRLYEAPFVVVSHGTQADPILNYGNQRALELWETDFVTLTSMPSRLTAEPMHRDERALLMARAARDGFVDDYRGIRISCTGKRFLIERAVVWNLVDACGQRVGQAATFSDWKMLPPVAGIDSDPSNR